MEWYSFGNICERDMDMLFLESIITDCGFARMILDKTELKGNVFKNISIELSKTDSELGESDITWVVEVEGDRYGILIEDKIDAIAMEEQYERYKKRGEKGIKNGDYIKYFIFIFCPKDYRRSDSEAEKYDHHISYEDFREYYANKEDALSSFKYNQLNQALTKAKRPSNVTLNEAVNAYFRKYSQYQKEHYPTLDLRTKETSNGYWAHYGTRFGRVYLLHKIQDGCVDLTFPNAADKISLMGTLASKLESLGMNSLFAEPTGKSAVFRIKVSALDMQNDFEETEESDLKECFDAIQKLTDIANVFEEARKIAGL